MSTPQISSRKSPRFTYDDYCAFPDDGRRHELIDGEHYVTPSPNTAHQRTTGRLFALLHGRAMELGRGEAFVAPYDVLFSRHDVVQPDVLWISPERASIVTPANLQGAPDLVVEVLSPSTRKIDETLKRKLYESRGVVEYWIVDPELERVRVHRREGEGFSRAVELAAENGDRLPFEPLDLELDLSELFA